MFILMTTACRCTTVPSAPCLGGGAAPGRRLEPLDHIPLEARDHLATTPQQNSKLVTREDVEVADALLSRCCRRSCRRWQASRRWQAGRRRCRRPPPSPPLAGRSLPALTSVSSSRPPGHRPSAPRQRATPKRARHKSGREHKHELHPDESGHKHELHGYCALGSVGWQKIE